MTEIEKNSLIGLTDGVKADVSGNETANFTGKDKRLVSTFQTNSSKIVDENGEPKVVYHGTPNLNSPYRHLSTPYTCFLLLHVLAFGE